MMPRRPVLLFLLGLLLLAGCCPPGVTTTSYELHGGNPSVVDQRAGN